MSTPKLQVLLRVGISCLVLAALTSSGCARFYGTVDFTADPTSGKAPLSVQFTPVVEGAVRRYIWSFGDGQTSTERSPEHTYADAGTYTVILMVDPRRGEPASARKEGCVTVTAGGFGSPPPQLIAEDDDFDIAFETPTYNQYRELCYELDVLANDVSAEPAAELTIVGISAFEYLEYDEFGREIDLPLFRVSIAGGGWSGKLLELVPTHDLSHYEGRVSFFYLVHDGQSTEQAEVTITLPHYFHPP
jgi:hypothetical protein